MAQEFNTKVIDLSKVREDLNNGLTKWKKDDLGFGSLEKKYSLTLSEMIQLLAHPKVKNMDTKIPEFVINDDIQDEEEIIEEQAQETKIEVRTPVVEQPKVRTLTQEKPQVKYEAFI